MEEEDTTVILVQEDAAQEGNDDDEEMEVLAECLEGVCDQKTSVTAASNGNVLTTPSYSCTACEGKMEKIIALQKSKSCHRKRLNKRNEIIRNLKAQNKLLIAVSKCRNLQLFCASKNTILYLHKRLIIMGENSCFQILGRLIGKFKK